MRYAALIAAFVLPLGAAGAAERDPFAGRVAGKPANCIHLSMASNPIVVDARTIAYRESGRRMWRTQPIGQCTRLNQSDTLVIELLNGYLCRNDRFRVLSPGQSIPSGTCRFDVFVPYDRP